MVRRNPLFLSRTCGLMGSVIRIKTVPLLCTSSVISSYSPYTVHIRCLLRCNLLCVHHGSTPRTVQNRCHNVFNSLLPPDESYTLSLSPIHPNPLFLLYIIVLTPDRLLCIILVLLIVCHPNFGSHIR